LHNAIVWQDRRTAPLCKELQEAEAESLVRERTGMVIDPYFSGTKDRLAAITFDGDTGFANPS
jgi:glycerol kinase